MKIRGEKRLKKKFLNSCMNLITETEGDLKEEDKEKVLYGLEGIYLSFSKMIILNIIAFCLGIWKEFILSTILFNILRFPGFGFHAKNSITCLLISSILMIGVPYLLLNLTLSFTFKFVISIICISCFLLYAPADTEKRPLTNKKKRRIRKISATILAILYSIIILFTNNDTIVVLFLSGLIIETILIIPITYSFYGMPYRNYLKV